MEYRVEVGKTLTVTDPETGEPVTMRVVASEDGKARITVEAPPNVRVRHNRDPEPLPRVIH